MDDKLTDEFLSRLFQAIRFQPKEDVYEEVKDMIAIAIDLDTNPGTTAISICHFLDIEIADNKDKLTELLKEIF